MRKNTDRYVYDGNNIGALPQNEGDNTAQKQNFSAEDCLPLATPVVPPPAVTMTQEERYEEVEKSKNEKLLAQKDLMNTFRQLSDKMKCILAPKTKIDLPFIIKTKQELDELCKELQENAGNYLASLEKEQNNWSNLLETQDNSTTQNRNTFFQQSKNGSEQASARFIPPNPTGGIRITPTLDGAKADAFSNKICHKVVNGFQKR